MLTAERRRTRRVRLIQQSKIIGSNPRYILNNRRDRKLQGWNANRCALPTLGVKPALKWGEEYYYSTINTFKSDDKAYIILNDLLDTTRRITNRALKQNLNVHDTIIWMLNDSYRIWRKLIKYELNIEVFKKPTIILTNTNGKYSIKLGTNFHSTEPLGLPIIKDGNDATLNDELVILQYVSNIFGVEPIHRSIEMELDNLEEEYDDDEWSEERRKEYSDLLTEISCRIEKAIHYRLKAEDVFNENSPKELLYIYKKLEELNAISYDDREFPDLEKFFDSNMFDETIFFYEKKGDDITPLIENDFECMMQSDIFIPPFIFEPVDIATKTFPLRMEILEKLSEYYYAE